MVPGEAEMKVCVRWLVLTVTAILMPAATLSQDTAFPPQSQQIPPPPCLTMHGAWEGRSSACTDQTHAQWMSDIQHWRNERRIRIGYDGARYAMPALTWTQASFIQPQMMVHDRYFYDPISGKYTVDRYLDDLEKTLSAASMPCSSGQPIPNMGIDNRNQHDMIRSHARRHQTGCGKMVARFSSPAACTCLFPMMMWDQGTREPGKPWTAEIAELMKEIGADGINGDTQDGVPLAYSVAADAVKHPLAFEPEGSPSDEALAWNVMTWGQYKYPFVPEVDRFKWLETRHMVNISDRWARDKTSDLQYAFFNGIGWESWENVWGIWNGITPRDAEATRRVSLIERAVAPFLTSAEWEPHFPMKGYGVYASRWPLNGETVWTVVNRNEYDVEGAQMVLADVEGMRYFDIYHGVELTAAHEKGMASVSIPMEAHGYGAILATTGEPREPIRALMQQMKSLTAVPLSSYSHEWKALPQTLVEIEATSPGREAPEGMIKIPAGPFLFEVEGTEIEGSDDVGVDVEYPWESTARRFHSHPMEMRAFYIDRFPVTNAEFSRFMKSTHYRPADALNFLRDWRDGSFPAGWANKPVTWVSLEDARAYAKWAGKRLPHEWEWQYAAQGTGGRRYPWGEAWDVHAVPTPNTSRNLTSPDDVDAHPSGASAFGVMDMVGNVWQWTDEYVDEHTRAGIVRGGSNYKPQGSVWYFPQAYANGQHSKLLLMSPSMDRSGTLGFRCVQDAADHQAQIVGVATARP